MLDDVENMRLLYYIMVVFYCLLPFQVRAGDVSASYLYWKEALHEKYGFDYWLRTDFLAQRGSPNGNETILRDKYEIAAGIDIFQSDILGSGSVQFLYSDINYPEIQANKMAKKLGVIDPINDDDSRKEYFKKLVYTQRLSGNLQSLSFSLGQYTIGSFSKVKYDAKPWNYFNNYALQKNVTRAHPLAGFGSYISYDILTDLTVIGGIQSSTNYAPQNVRVKYIDRNRWTNFIYASWNPKLEHCGKTNITGWIYHSPAIRKYPGQFNKAFSTSANGWALNFKNDIDKWTFALKANGSTGNRRSIKQSYGMEMIYKDPFDGQKIDQIGLGFAMNKVDKHNQKNVHPWENITELYWGIGISDYAVVIPDVQIYIKPALKKDRNITTVTSLQIKFFL